MTRHNPNATRIWWSRFFVSFVIRGRGIGLGWQWEGDHVDWRCSPVTLINWHRPL